MTLAESLLVQAAELGLAPVFGEASGLPLEVPPLIAEARTAAAVWVAANHSMQTDLADRALDALAQAIATAGEERRLLSDLTLLVPGSDRLPWSTVIPPSRGLALLYNFSPFQDTGSTVASKRLRQFGASVDVIACSFLHHKKADPTIERISAPYVASKQFLPFKPSWATWAAHAAFAQKAAGLAGRYIAHREEPYEFLYSRAMWSPSIIAGALVKLDHPEIEWIAEFSDPLSQDVEGRHRGRPITEDTVSARLVQELESVHGELTDDERSVFAIAELLAFTFADRILFTNRLQMETMLAKVARPELRERIRAVATVSHHPSLPRPFYAMERSAVAVDADTLNIAYFGEFYSSRGLTEVTTAMRTLPPALQERVRLHVFTNYVPASEGGSRPRGFSRKQYADLVQRALDGVGAEGIEHLVRFHPSLPFLRFLSATDSFDLLVVRDASTGAHHDVNPYLPSKVSDYSGSRARTWAIVEEGSTLSGLPVPARSVIEDTLGAREVLWSALERKFGPQTVDSWLGGAQ